MADPLTPEQKRQQYRKRLVAQANGLLNGVVSQLRPGDLAVDCGANVGSITARLAQSGADVIAFEPDPVAFEALEQATSGFEAVTLERGAVGVTSGAITLFRGEGFEANPVAATRRSTTVPGGNRVDEESGFDVPLINLPEKLTQWSDARGEIAFLKLDIEGAELDILTEMLRLNLFERVKLTVAELHGYKFPALRPEFLALRETLTKRYPQTRVYLDWI